MRTVHQKNFGYSLLELMAALVLIAILATMVIPRIQGKTAEANQNACSMNKAEIELQAQLWYRNHGSYPASSLSDAGADVNYFPEGLPTCPVDNTAYTIDTSTGIVSGHTH